MWRLVKRRKRPMKEPRSGGRKRCRAILPMLARSLSSEVATQTFGNFADATILKTFGEIPANLDEL